MTKHLLGNKKPKSILIVGAGASGIKLAHTLWKECRHRKKDDGNSIASITILEANDYVGGRVRNFRFEGHTVEMGANWISGRETAFDNPIWRLAREIDLRGSSSEGRDDPDRLHAVGVSAGEEGAPAPVVTDEYLEQARRFGAIYAEGVRHAQGPPPTLSYQRDADVRSVVERYGWPSKRDLTNVERAAEHNQCEVWAADSLDQLSAAHDMRAGANDVEVGQDETFVEDPRGFNSIFEGMVKEMTTGATDDDSCRTKILLGQQVMSIHYEPERVKVVARDLASDEETEYPADLVVSTVSLGVLQKGCINFIPPMPRWKVDAFNKIEMFCFAKVYAKFHISSVEAWPRDKDYLAFIADGEEHRGYYPIWMRYQNYIDRDDAEDGSHQLYMCYLGGAQARRVESLCEERLKDEIEALFGRAFGTSPACRPVAAAATDWSKNPRFCGSYSSYPKDALAEVSLEDLQRGLSGTGDNHDGGIHDNDAATTLYFAGEALDKEYNGWIQGAYFSGERVARTILTDIGAAA